MMQSRWVIGSCMLVLWLGTFTYSWAAGDLLIDDAQLTVVRYQQGESVAVPGVDYAEFTMDTEQATFLISECPLERGVQQVQGNRISQVRWEPSGDDTLITVEFNTPPQSSAINSMGGTELKPQVPHVIAAFGFGEEEPERASYPVMGSYGEEHRSDKSDQYGDYELPDFPPYRYSDARVSLKVRNTDFRDVLWLLSEVGNISIVLDPYWATEPTGNRRPPGGGIDPGGGGDGGTPPGFRPGGGFSVPPPREGTGTLTLNFKDVPFDTALDLVLMSVGLVKVDIWPGTFD